jgi:transposase-like protein
MNCPNCKSSDISKVKWNVWGGLIGALIADKLKCNNCKAQFTKAQALGVQPVETNTMNNEQIVSQKLEIPETCPHCKNPNSKRIRLCEWCGNQII